MSVPFLHDDPDDDPSGLMTLVGGMEFGITFFRGRASHGMTASHHLRQLDSINAVHIAHKDTVPLLDSYNTPYLY